jgi:pimeloyl-ACP methyl ester carboxylesterase
LSLPEGGDLGAITARRRATKHTSATLIVWGRNDQSFPADGAQAYLRDLPKAELHLLNTGHFALEDRGAEIARLMLDFLNRAVAK